MKSRPILDPFILSDENHKNNEIHPKEEKNRESVKAEKKPETQKKLYFEDEKNVVESEDSV